jgi:predicted nucleic acid-binding protein
MQAALLDANLIIALFLRPEHALLRAARAGACRLALCPYVISEARRMMRRAFPARAERFEQFLRELPALEIPDADPEAVARWEGYLSDPADVPVLAAAIAAGLDVVVTSDRDFRADARATLAAERDPIQVLSVPELLATL